MCHERVRNPPRGRSGLPIPVRQISRALRSAFPPLPPLALTPACARGILFPLASEQLAFHRSVLLPVFFFCHSSPSPPLPPLLTRAPSRALYLAARCQFEFGARATGQRVSTKNQFLNARLFRAERSACYPSSASSPPPPPPFPPVSLCLSCAASIFFGRRRTLTPRRSSRAVTELARAATPSRVRGDNEFRLIKSRRRDVEVDAITRAT